MLRIKKKKKKKNNRRQMSEINLPICCGDETNERRRLNFEIWGES
jgi:hypothetical protein